MSRKTVKEQRLDYEEMLADMQGLAVTALQADLHSKTESYLASCVTKTKPRFNSAYMLVLTNEIKAHIIRKLGAFIDMDKELKIELKGGSAKIVLQDSRLSMLYEWFMFVEYFTNRMTLDVVFNEINHGIKAGESALLESLKGKDWRIAHDTFKLSDDEIMALDKTVTPDNITQDLREAVITAGKIKAFVKEQLPTAAVEWFINKSRVTLMLDINNDGNSIEVTDPDDILAHVTCKVTFIKSNPAFSLTWFDRLKGMQVLLAHHNYKLTGKSFVGWRDETMDEDQKALLLDKAFMAEQVRLTAEDVKGLLVNLVAGFIDVDKNLVVWVDGCNARVTLCGKEINSLLSASMFFNEYMNSKHLNYLLKNLITGEIMALAMVTSAVKNDEANLTNEALAQLDSTLNPSFIPNGLKVEVAKARLIQSLVKEKLPEVVIDVTVVKCRVELWIDANNDGNKERLTNSEQITNLLPDGLRKLA